MPVISLFSLEILNHQRRLVLSFKFIFTQISQDIHQLSLHLLEDVIFSLVSSLLLVKHVESEELSPVSQLS
jgi:hypothetical protein